MAEGITLGRAVVTLLAAAMIPFATYVHGCNELEVEKARNKHEQRMDQLDRAVNTDLDERSREVVLKFLVATVPPDDKVHGWAESTLAEVEEILELRRQAIESEAALSDLRDQHAITIAALRSEQASDAKIQAINEEQARELQLARSDLAVARRELRKRTKGTTLATGWDCENLLRPNERRDIPNSCDMARIDAITGRSHTHMERFIDMIGEGVRDGREYVEFQLMKDESTSVPTATVAHCFCTFQR